MSHYNGIERNRFIYAMT